MAGLGYQSLINSTDCLILRCLCSYCLKVNDGLWSSCPLEPPILHTVSETSPPTITFTQIHSYTACVSQWTDEELDYEIQLLHQHFPNAGITMFHGHFCQLGENVHCEWIC